jgi:hypothetical protein
VPAGSFGGLPEARLVLVLCIWRFSSTVSGACPFMTVLRTSSLLVLVVLRDSGFRLRTPLTGFESLALLIVKCASERQPAM